MRRRTGAAQVRGCQAGHERLRTIGSRRHRLVIRRPDTLDHDDGLRRETCSNRPRWEPPARHGDGVRLPGTIPRRRMSREGHRQLPVRSGRSRACRSHGGDGASRRGRDRPARATSGVSAEVGHSYRSRGSRHQREHLIRSSCLVRVWSASSRLRFVVIGVRSSYRLEGWSRPVTEMLKAARRRGAPPRARGRIEEVESARIGGENGARWPGSCVFDARREKRAPRRRGARRRPLHGRTRQ